MVQFNKEKNEEVNVGTREQVAMYNESTIGSINFTCSEFVLLNTNDEGIVHRQGSICAQ